LQLSAEFNFGVRAIVASLDIMPHLGARTEDIGKNVVNCRVRRPTACRHWRWRRWDPGQLPLARSRCGAVWHDRDTVVIHCCSWASASAAAPAALLVAPASLPAATTALRRLRLGLGRGRPPSLGRGESSGSDTYVGAPRQSVPERRQARREIARECRSVEGLLEETQWVPTFLVYCTQGGIRCTMAA
jgi:hypothetical protein